MRRRLLFVLTVWLLVGCAAVSPLAIPTLFAQSPPTCSRSVGISQTGGTQLVTGTAGNRIYICSFVVVSATAQSVSLVEGTGSVCATGTAALIGGTSASLALAANGGFALVLERAWLTTRTVADNLCLLQSGAGNVSGTLTYVISP